MNEHEHNMTPVGLTLAQVQAILQFLARSQIVGSEAAAFMECVMALRMIASPPGASVEPDSGSADQR